MSQQPSPFIPPLPNIGGRASSGGSHGHTPVIPGPPPRGEPAGWARHPGEPGTYPVSPYNTGYIPHLAPSTPVVPGAYIPAHIPLHSYYTPAAQPIPVPHVNEGGFSSDYTGYPQGPPPASMHSTPYNPHGSAPLQPMSGWGPPPRPGPAYHPPHSAGPFGGFPHGPPPNPNQWGPPPWNVPPLQMHHTPAHDPWGLGLHSPAGPPPGWAQQMGMGMGPPPHHQFGPPRPDHVSDPLSGRIIDRFDKINPFLAGPHYGPVLDPFLVKVVNAQVKLNPLLEPLPETGADRPHLKWNMLFPSNDCQLSTDPSHVSWGKGRDDPATYPRVTSLNIVSENIPWLVKISAGNPNIGVTCGEVIDGLSMDFQRYAARADFEALPRAKQDALGEVYRNNRSRMEGMPGGRLKEGMRRLDYLGRDTVYGGIMREDGLSRKILNAGVPCTFVLKCVRRYALTLEEVREHDARQKAREEMERRKAREEEEERRRTSRRATVDDDDSDESVVGDND